MRPYGHERHHGGEAASLGSHRCYGQNQTAEQIRNDDSKHVSRGTNEGVTVRYKIITADSLAIVRLIFEPN